MPRSVVEADGDGDVHLLTASLAYTDLEGDQGLSEPVHLRLPRLPAAAFAAIAVNELVSQRAAELRAAALQEEGRQAARIGDWNRVQELLGDLRLLAESNPWLRASIEQLEGYARRRETQHFSKEAHYTAWKMRSRLVATDEGGAVVPGAGANKTVVSPTQARAGQALDATDRDQSGSPK